MGKKLEFIAETDMSAVQAVMSVAAMTHAAADRLIKSGEVRIDGKRVRSNVQVSAGAIVRVFLPDALYTPPRPKIVYDDDNIVVFDKPKHTSFDALPALYGMPLFAVHRLDTNTTGLIVFAKTESARDELEAAFKERRAVKRYKAVVCPSPQTPHATLTAYTAMHDGVAAVFERQERGLKTMITEYDVAERIGEAAVLTVTPHTGRTHQIRAHLKFIGCPIVGDPKYGGEKKVGAPDSQMLAAVELTFTGLKGELEYLNGRTFTTDAGFDLDVLRRSV